MAPNGHPWTDDLLAFRLNFCHRKKTTVIDVASPIRLMTGCWPSRRMPSPLFDLPITSYTGRPRAHFLFLKILRLWLIHPVRFFFLFSILSTPLTSPGPWVPGDRVWISASIGGNTWVFSFFFYSIILDLVIAGPCTPDPS